MYMYTDIPIPVAYPFVVVAKVVSTEFNFNVIKYLDA